MVTDNGHFIVDVDFGEIPLERVHIVNQQLKGIVGVAETGLFVQMAQLALFGNEQGQVDERARK